MTIYQDRIASLTGIPKYWWPLQDASGTVNCVVNGGVTDADMTVASGSLTYQQPGPNAEEYSVYFDAGEYLTTALSTDDDLIDASPELTVEFWVKTSINIESANAQLFGQRADWELYLNTSEQFNVYLNYGDGDDNTNSGVNLADGQWHHVVVYWEAGTTNSWIMIDGEVVASGFQAGANSSHTQTYQITLGGFSYTPFNQFAGYISHACIYVGELSQEDAALNYAYMMGTAIIEADTAEIEFAVWDPDIETSDETIINVPLATITFTGYDAEVLTEELGPGPPQVCRPSYTLESGGLARSNTGLADFQHLQTETTSNYLYRTYPGGFENPQTIAAEWRFSPAVNPLRPSEPHTFNFSLQRNSAAPLEVWGDTIVYLKSGNTTIWSQNLGRASGNYNSGTVTLTTEQVNAITDWTDLRFRVTVGSTGYTLYTSTWRMYWVTLNLPGQSPIHPDPVGMVLVGYSPTLLVEGTDTSIELDTTAEITFTTYEPTATAQKTKITRKPNGVYSNGVYSSHQNNLAAVLRDNSDTTWIYNFYVTGSGVAQMSLDPLPGGDPDARPIDPVSGGNYKLRVRAACSEAPPPNNHFAVYLVDLSRPAGDQQITPVFMISDIFRVATNGNFTWYEQNMTQEQVDRILDWQNLRLYISYGVSLAGSPPATTGVQWECSEVEFIHPVVGTSVQPTKGHISIQGIAPTIITTRIDPDPAPIVFHTYDPDVFPLPPQATDIYLAGEFGLRSVSIETQLLDTDWPALPELQKIAIFGTELYYAGPSGFGSINTVTRQIGTGWEQGPANNALALNIDNINGNRAIVGLSASPFYRIYNLSDKVIETGWPVASGHGAVTCAAFWLNSARIIMGATESGTSGTLLGQLRVLDTSTKQLVSGFPDTLPGLPLSIVAVGDKAFIGHRGGKMLTVINSNGTIDSSWPNLPIEPRDMVLNSDATKILIAGEDRAVVLNLLTKAITPIYSGGAVTQERNVVSAAFVTDDVATIGAIDLWNINIGSNYYFNYNTQEHLPAWQDAGDDVYAIAVNQVTQTAPPTQDVSISVNNVRNISFTKFNPSIETLTEQTPNTGNITFTTLAPEIESPDITVPVTNIRSIIFTGRIPIIYPDNVAIQVDNIRTIQFVKYAPTVVSITTGDIKIIPVDDISLTARDAKRITEIPLGSIMHDGAKIFPFRVGNLSENSAFIISANGANHKLLTGVDFSIDKLNWQPQITVRVDLNKISPVIYMRVAPEKDAPIGDSTFLLSVLPGVIIG